MSSYSASVYRLSAIICFFVFLKALLQLVSLYSICTWLLDLNMSTLSALDVLNIAVAVLIVFFLLSSLRLVLGLAYNIVWYKSHLLFLCYDYIQQTVAPVRRSIRRGLKTDIVIVDYLFVVMSEGYFSGNKKALKGLSFSTLMKLLVFYVCVLVYFN